MNYYDRPTFNILSQIIYVSQTFVWFQPPLHTLHSYMDKNKWKIVSILQHDSTMLTMSNALSAIKKIINWNLLNKMLKLKLYKYLDFI